MRGGYKLISLKGTAFTLGTAAVVKGIYNAIVNSYHKHLILCDIVVGGTQLNDCELIVQKSGDDFVGEVYGHSITIEDDDKVTIAEIVEGD